MPTAPRSLKRVELIALTCMAVRPDGYPSGELVEAVERQAGVADRTVRRALENLEAWGFAQATGLARSRKWVAIAPPPKSARPSINQAIALLTLRNLAHRHLPSSVIGSLEDDFAAAAHVLEEHPTASALAAARQWMGKTARLNAGYPLIPPTVDEALLDVIGRALYNDESLDVTYRNAQRGPEGVKQYRILPHAIVEKGPLWYLVARNKRRSGDGSFFPLRLDRIVAVKPAGIDMVRDKTFSLETYIKADKRMEFFAGEPIRIELRVHEAGYEHAFRSLRLAEDQEIVDEDGGFRLAATVCPSVPFFNLMLEKSPSVEILSPPWLRDEIVRSLTLALSRYDPRP